MTDSLSLLSSFNIHYDFVPSLQGSRARKYTELLNAIVDMSYDREGKKTAEYYVDMKDRYCLTLNLKRVKTNEKLHHNYLIELSLFNFLNFFEVMKKQHKTTTSKGLVKVIVVMAYGNENKKTCLS